MGSTGSKESTRSTIGVRGEPPSMSSVFVVDTEHRPLDPVHPGHARRLLARGQAAVRWRSPFTLILKRAVPEAAPTPLRLKIDPASRSTGLTPLTESETPAAQRAAAATGRAVWAGKLHHRGHGVHERLVARAAVRRFRRQRPTRYRPPRCANRRRA